MRRMSKEWVGFGLVVVLAGMLTHPWARWPVVALGCAMVAFGVLTRRANQ